jgi:hypothetical protein
MKQSHKRDNQVESIWQRFCATSPKTDGDCSVT